MKLKPKRSFNNWIDSGDNVKLLIDYPTRQQSQKLQDILFDERLSENVRMAKYAQLYIKFTVKDWQGIDEKFQLVDNEMEDNLWWRFVEDVEQAISVWKVIDDQLKFTQDDKKKLD